MRQKRMGDFMSKILAKKITFNYNIKSGEETKAIVKKSRIGNLPKILEVKNYSSIEKALNENNTKQLAKDSKE